MLGIGIVFEMWFDGLYIIDVVFDVLVEKVGVWFDDFVVVMNDWSVVGIDGGELMKFVKGDVGVLLKFMV